MSRRRPSPRPFANPSVRLIAASPKEPDQPVAKNATQRSVDELRCANLTWLKSTCKIDHAEVKKTSDNEVIQAGDVCGMRYTLLPNWVALIINIDPGVLDFGWIKR